MWDYFVLRSIVKMATDEYPVTPPHLPTGEDAKTPPPSSGNRVNRPGSPDPNCAICLGELDNMSYTDSCYHKFCFLCLKEWSKVSFYSVRSYFRNSNCITIPLFVTQISAGVQNAPIQTKHILLLSFDVIASHWTSFDDFRQVSTSFDVTTIKNHLPVISHRKLEPVLILCFGDVRSPGSEVLYCPTSDAM
jgi:hypothetical protein